MPLCRRDALESAAYAAEIFRQVSVMPPCSATPRRRRAALVTIRQRHTLLLRRFRAPRVYASRGVRLITAAAAAARHAARFMQQRCRFAARYVLAAILYISY